jgi:low affinity Fe/Cu permease
MSSQLFCSCFDDTVDLSTSAQSFLNVGTLAAYTMLIAYFCYSIVRGYGARQTVRYFSFMSSLWAVMSWLVWGNVYMVSVFVSWYRPLGEAWRSGCAQCNPANTLFLYDTMNVYAFPDLFLTIAVCFGTVAIYVDYVSSDGKRFPWVHAVILVGVFVGYSIAELANNRQTWQQYLLNLITAFAILMLILVVFAYAIPHNPMFFDAITASEVSCDDEAEVEEQQQQQQQETATKTPLRKLNTAPTDSADSWYTRDLPRQVAAYRRAIGPIKQQAQIHTYLARNSPAKHGTGRVYADDFAAGGGGDDDDASNDNSSIIKFD